MDFGWTLSDVVKRTRELRELRIFKENTEICLKLTEIIEVDERITIKKQNNFPKLLELKNENKNNEEKDSNVFEISSDGEPLMEIGTWSNDMANDIQTFSPEFETNFASSSGMVMTDK